MVLNQMKEAVRRSIEVNGRADALLDWIKAINDTYERTVVSKARSFDATFTDEEVAGLIAARAGQWLPVRDVFEAIGRPPRNHGESVAAGSQLRRLFEFKKVGPISMYLIERREAIA